MTNQYIQMLQEGLDRKITILKLIEAKNREQEQIFTDLNSTPDDLEKNIDQKSNYVDELNSLDAGFQQVYDRVSDLLKEHREDYLEEIAHMQDQIRTITDLSASIQAQEQHNKNLAQQRFSMVRKQVKEVRQSQKAVSSYYQNMMKINYVDPQFMDRKK